MNYGLILVDGAGIEPATSALRTLRCQRRRQRNTAYLGVF